jgi:hypothetical protein
MAGRIRSLKPETLDNARTAGLSDTAFRLFVALILEADDHGNGYGDARRLRAKVWWAAEPVRTIDEALAEVEAAGLVRRYEVKGQAYVSLLGWQEHQRVDKPGKPRVPGPDAVDLARPRGSAVGDRRSEVGDQARDPRETPGKVPGPSRDPRETPARLPVKPRDAAQLLASAGAPRVVLPLDCPSTETGLQALHERVLCAVLAEKRPTAEELRKVATWLNQPGVWTHLRSGISVRQLLGKPEQLAEAIDLARAWDGAPIAAPGRPARQGSTTEGEDERPTPPPAEEVLGLRKSRRG